MQLHNARKSPAAQRALAAGYDEDDEEQLMLAQAIQLSLQDQVQETQAQEQVQETQEQEPSQQ